MQHPVNESPAVERHSWTLRHQRTSLGGCLSIVSPSPLPPPPTSHPHLPPAPTHCLAPSPQHANVWHSINKMSQSEGGCGKRQSRPERSGEPSNFHPPLPRCSERQGCDVIDCCVSKLCSQQLNLRIFFFFFKQQQLLSLQVPVFATFFLSDAATHAMADKCSNAAKIRPVIGSSCLQCNIVGSVLNSEVE